MKTASPQERQRPAQSGAVQKQSHIPFIANRGRLLPGDSFSDVLASSAPGAWSDLVLEQHRCPPTELSELAYRDHVLVLNAGRSLTCEYKHDGRWKSIKKGSEALSLFPSGSQFDRRMQTTAHVFYLALDPMFFVRNAGDEMPPRPEFLEQRCESDLVLSNIARTLRAASDSDLRHDLLFGSAMALSLARHLLLRYSSNRTPAKIGMKYGMSPGMLKRAVDFMEAHLQSGMTVAQIAEATRISPSHFTRLFKNATGQSPYQYVMRLRINRAKEMMSGKSCSLQDVSYSLGFADQSHLTRAFRRTFGVTPGFFLEQNTRA